ncbi:LOW QUALITY PROTEIN: 60S ribosomal protein L32-like [Sagmatias obliquidens]|uniref:LOW QUALITY PROTEIN: 60S ribosomal protein L32-like n=1 Tax=Sagmatias obliquidens TaxID=3371155 RepID=UPI000F4461AF|nr:LOW QUALITY PROTEIN: 60S ribosomal protein L32-like [Lagenorhynchus obliquidens]
MACDSDWVIELITTPGDKVYRSPATNTSPSPALVWLMFHSLKVPWRLQRRNYFGSSWCNLQCCLGAGWIKAFAFKECTFLNEGQKRNKGKIKQVACLVAVEDRKRGGSHVLLGIVATLRPLLGPKMIQKKRTKKFIRHQSDRYAESKQNRWKPRAIDSRAHRRFKGQILMPNIGYWSNKKTKHRLPSGFRMFLVHKVKKPEVLPMCDTSYCAEIACNVSSENCRAMVERAAQQAVGVTGPNARLRGKKMNRQPVCTFCLC